MLTHSGGDASKPSDISKVMETVLPKTGKDVHLVVSADGADGTVSPPTPKTVPTTVHAAANSLQMNGDSSDSENSVRSEMASRNVEIYAASQKNRKEHCNLKKKFSNLRGPKPGRNYQS